MTLHRAPRRFLGLGPRRQVFDVGVAVLSKTWWVATSALLVVAASVHFDLVTESNLGPLATTSEVAAADDGFAVVDSEFYSYPNARYAGVDLAVIDSRIVPRFQTGSPIAVVEIGVRNQTTQQARLPMKMVRLVGPNGAQTDIDRFEYTEFATRMVVEPGRTARGLAVFNLPIAASDKVADYHLEISENGRWPVSVPLSGEVSLPPDPYPQPLEVTKSEDHLEVPDLVVELTEATNVLEYGLYRASIGRHLAVITMEMTGSTADATAALDRELWTLIGSKLGGARNVIGQYENRAIRVLSSEVVTTPVPGSAGTGRNSQAVTESTVSLQLVFSYSTESSRLSLRFGDPGERQTVAEFDVQAFE